MLRSRAPVDGVIEDSLRTKPGGVAPFHDAQDGGVKLLETQAIKVFSLGVRVFEPHKDNGHVFRGVSESGPLLEESGFHNLHLRVACPVLRNQENNGLSIEFHSGGRERQKEQNER